MSIYTLLYLVMSCDCPCCITAFNAGAFVDTLLFLLSYDCLYCISVVCQRSFYFFNFCILRCHMIASIFLLHLITVFLLVYFCIWLCSIVGCSLSCTTYKCKYSNHLPFVY